MNASGLLTTQSEPHLMLKPIIAGLFWESHSPTLSSSCDTDKAALEDKAEAIKSMFLKIHR